MTIKLCILPCFRVGERTSRTLSRVYSMLRRALSTKSLQSFDVTVIGAGIIGLSTACELQRRHPALRIAVLDKEKEVGRHQSRHNSGVIHSGIYYRPGSLQAKLCVRGSQLMYDFVDKHFVPFRRCGKLITAVDESELPQLRAIYERGIENGVEGIRIIDRDEILQMEPNLLGGQVAIHVPTCGITDFGMVCERLAYEFQRNGGTLLTSFCVHSICRGENSLTINERVSTGRLIACAGAYSDRIAAMTNSSATPRIVPVRGEWRVLKDNWTHLVNGHCIYPVPNPALPFLGVHFTPKVSGDVWIGPNAVLSASREGYSFFDVNLNDLRENFEFEGFRKMVANNIFSGFGELVRSAVPAAQLVDLQKYIPMIEASHMHEFKRAGVRAMAINEDGSMVDDFVIDDSEDQIDQGVIHVRNAPSPAATASLAIGEVISDRVEEKLL